ncbi:DUF1189 domain-containing protein [Filibacter tadaridae]|uniref:4-hydroxy-3-methylbut-2-en-1-yl diphosphate synthase n=1 Tax=Filibacter tadaridae TaxID=2483811 RepID=A0A3P5XCP9_9BACL|nr:DUF1189 family protein [Filibacter tadaridae]VDC32441.1 hypothetical protein FILTAD_02669 [Filibacter tadaridae]
MKFHQIFKAAIHEPKKLAAFRLLPIGKVFRYVFIFVTLLTLISFSRYLIGDTAFFESSPELKKHGEKIGWLIYPIAFVLQIVISTFYVFIRISVFAYIGLLLVKLMKRRGQYQHMFKTSAIAMTVPILLTILLDFNPLLGIINLLISSVIHFMYIGAAARYYPKKLK